MPIVPNTQPNFPFGWKGTLLTVDLRELCPNDLDPDADALEAIWRKENGLIEVFLASENDQKAFLASTTVSVWDGKRWSVRYSDAEAAEPSPEEPLYQLIESLSLFADHKPEEDGRDIGDLAQLRVVARLAVERLERNALHGK